MRTESRFNAELYNQIDELRQMTVRQLREKYAQVFGEETRSNHKQFLFRRMAWRLQALAEGGLSERAKRRALEIANDADLRIRAPKTAFRGDTMQLEERTATTCLSTGRDPRLPVSGTLLTRRFKGRTVVVEVLEDGFRYDGAVYKSLTAIANLVTGAKWNGFEFFRQGLNREGANGQQ